MGLAVEKNNVFKLLACLWKHLEKHRKKQFIGLFILMLFSALAEIGTIGLVVPFLGVLADPELAFNYVVAREVGLFFGVLHGYQMVLPLTLLFVSFAVLSAILRLLLLWVSARLSNMVGVDVGYKVYLNTLYQPYQKHLNQNSSLIVNAITQKVAVSIHALSLALSLCISVILMVTIGLMIFMINVKIALLVMLIFGGSYGLVGIFLRKKLIRNSEIIAENSSKLIQSIQEGVGGIRDVLLDGSQVIYAENYRQTNIPLQLSNAKNVLFSGSPRYVMEAMGMVLIGLLAYMLSQRDEGISGALPLLGGLALAAQRMLPNLQLAYASWAGISGCQASLKDTLDLLNQPILCHEVSEQPLCCMECIELDRVSFAYVEQDERVLNDISIKIPKGSKVGVVGSTGSGKSTLMDILMGLLLPTDGRILIDGKHLNGKLIRGWQQSIAHVPQNIFLSDASIAENIAFGVPVNLIDMDRVKQAASQAQLASYVESLDLSYETAVGERGVRLSGGQRQRIGIARALYKQSNIIVFDEATSALDNSTERSVMESIDVLDSNLTIFIVAHRLATVRACDVILVLDNGCLVGTGCYEELLESCLEFQNISGYRSS